MTARKRIDRNSPAVKKIYYWQERIFSRMRDKEISPSSYIQLLSMFSKSEMDFSVMRTFRGVMDKKSIIKIIKLEDQILKKIYKGLLDHYAFSLLLKEFCRLLRESPSFHEEKDLQ